MHYIYKITILANNKIYIGQTSDLSVRKRQHIYNAKKSEPELIINRAMKKYCFTNGVFDPTKWSFQVIACCMTQEQVNDIEELIIIQENSHIRNKKGYNVSAGGSTAPKTPEWRQKLSNWHASLSPEEKEFRRQVLSEATRNQIATKGHPAAGRKLSPEQIEKFKNTRKERPFRHTDESKQKMSKSRRGKKQSEETIEKRTASIKTTHAKKIAELTASGELKCNAPGCDIIGQAQYRIIDGVRYCVKHAERVIRHGNPNTVIPAFAPNKGKILSEEKREKLKGRIPHNKGKNGPIPSEETIQKLQGRIPPNKTFIEEEKAAIILTSSSPAAQVARELGLTKRIVYRIKKDYKNIEEYRQDVAKAKKQEQKREQIITLHKLGMSQEEIAEKLDFNVSTVFDHIHKYYNGLR